MLKSTTEVANESYVAGWIPRLNQTAVSVPLAQGVMDVVRVVEAQLREHLGVEAVAIDVEWSAECSADGSNDVSLSAFAPDEPNDPVKPPTVPPSSGMGAVSLLELRGATDTSTMNSSRASRGSPMEEAGLAVGTPTSVVPRTPRCSNRRKSAGAALPSLTVGEEQEAAEMRMPDDMDLCQPKPPPPPRSPPPVRAYARGGRGAAAE